MKKNFLFLIAVLFMAAAFVGCGDSASSEPAPTDVITETVTDGDVVFEGEAAYYINEVYAEQIKRYHTAISEQWEASNDDPINEATANAIMDSHRVHYTALEYYPYSLYNPQ